MTARISQMWRHPIKSHGRESVASCILTEGQAMPWDRLWAVAHETSQADGSAWVPCANFSRVSKSAPLHAIAATLDETTGRLTLTHPERDPLEFDPDTEGDRLIDWTRGMIPENRAQSARVVRARAAAFTDSDFPSVTLLNHASHRAVEQKAGVPLSIHRWRGNLWIDGLAPWEEFDWIDRDVQLGEAIITVRERTDRCLSTHNNPETGRRDVPVLTVLDSWDHRDFSVRAEVIKGGRVAVGDEVKRL